MYVNSSMNCMKKLVNGDVSAVELTKAFLAHKDTVEPKVQAFLSDNRDYALEAAAAVDAKIAAGEAISDLAGIPGATGDNMHQRSEGYVCIEDAGKFQIAVQCDGHRKIDGC